MKKNINCIIGIGVSLLTWLMSTSTIFASEYPEYTVVPKMPHSQMKQSLGYWWLKVKPKSVQNLQLAISNNSSNIKRFNVSINNAVTNENMTVDYTKSAKQARKYLGDEEKASFSKMSRINNKKYGSTTVDVKSGENKQVSINLKIPARKFSGLLVGGVNVTEITDDSKNAGNVNNVFGYTYAVVLQESNKLPKPKIRIQSLGFSKKDKYFKVKLVNTSGNLAKNVKVHATVFNSKSKKVATYKSENGTLVPYATVPLTIKTQNGGVKPGLYSVKIRVEGSKFKDVVVNRNIQVTR